MFLTQRQPQRGKLTASTAPVNGNFYLPSLVSIIPRLGLGSPTFTRATARTIVDFEGILKTTKSGEAGFTGARRVENQFTYSEDLSNASWTKNGTGTVTGTNVLNMPADQDGIYKSVSTPGRVVVMSAVMSGTGTITFMAYNATIGVVPKTFTLTSTPTRYSFLFTPLDLTTSFYIQRSGTSATQVTITHMQLEKVTGQANRNPSEYVSVNSIASSIPDTVLSAELTTNGTFDADTDWIKGAGWTISGGKAVASSASSSLVETSKILAGKNYIVSVTISNYSAGTLYFYDDNSSFGNFTANGTYTLNITSTFTSFGVRGGGGFTGSVDNVSCKEVIHGAGVDGVQYFTTQNGNTVDGNGLVTEATGVSIEATEILDNPTFSADTNWTKGAGWSIAGGVAVAANASASIYQAPKLIVGSYYTVTFTIVSVSGGSIAPLCGGNSGTARTTVGTYTEVLRATATATAAFSATGFTGTIDNASYKLVIPGLMIGGQIQNKCTNYNVIPADSLSAEKLSTAQVQMDSGWNSIDGSSVLSGGTAIYTDTPNAAGLYIASIGTTYGKVYQVTFTIVSISKGGIKIILGDTNPGLGTIRTTAGTFTENIATGISTVHSIYIKTVGSTSCVIDNVSVKEAVMAVGTKAYYDGAAFQNPITNMVLSGDVASVLSIVDDTTQLTTDKLLNINPSGKVYQLDNSLGSTNAVVTIGGQAGNTNGHTFSVYGMRMSGAGHFQIDDNWGDTPAANMDGANYVRTKVTTVTGHTSAQMMLTCAAGVVGMFIVNQLEENPFATSEIITAGAATTRNQDVLTYLTTGNVRSDKGTMYCETTLSGINVLNQHLIMLSTSATRGLGKQLSDNGLVVYDGTNTVSTGVGASSLKIYKLAASWGNGGMSICVNGATVVTGSFDGDMNLTTNMQIGGPTALFGNARNTKIWKSKLSDSKIKQLTT